MRLKHLRLYNYCQHRELDIEIPPNGIIGLCGENGAGKSNILRAIKFAITGKTDKSNKQNDITWGETESYVYLEFEVNGQSGSITRNLHNSHTKLEFGSIQLKKSKDVNNQMESLFGCSFALAEKFIFVRQGELNELLNVTTAERIKLLHKLFGTDKIEALVKAVTSELASNSRFGSVEESSTSIRDQLTAQQNELASLQEAYELVDVTATRSQLDKLNAAIQDYEVTKRAYESQTYAKDLTELDSELTKLGYELDCAEMEVSGLKSKMPSEDEYDKAQASISSYDSKQQLYDRYKRLVDRSGVLIKELDRQSSAAPETPETAPEDLNKAIQDRDNKSYELQNLKSFLDSVDSSGGVCPTCGTEAVVVGGESENLSSLIDTKQKKFVAVKEQYDKLAAFVLDAQNAIKKYESDLLQYKSNKKAMTDELDRIVDDLESMGKQTRPNNPEKAKKFVEDYNANASEISRLESVISRLSAQYESKKDERTKIKAKAEEAASIKEVLDGFDYQKSLDNKSNLDSKLEQYQYARGQYMSKKELVDTLQSRYERTVELEKSFDKKLTYYSMLEKVKEVFHRDSYPAALISSQFKRLNSEWASVLDQLSIPFSVKINPDTSISVIFPDNMNAYTDDLSGGQKCCLSLSFLVAVNKLFTSDTSILALDEPTYGADPERIEGIANLLVNMQQYVSATGMQLFVVSHDERLRKGYNHVIDVD